MPPSKRPPKDPAQKELLDVLLRVYKALDRLGLNFDQPQGVPGTTEKIAMELKDGFDKVATALDNLADAIRDKGDKACMAHGRNARLSFLPRARSPARPAQEMGDGSAERRRHEKGLSRLCLTTPLLG